MADPIPLPTDQPPPKKKFGCLKIFLWTAGICFFLFILVVILVVQAVKWVENAPETTVATYPELKVSAGEEEDIDRIVAGIEQAKQRDALFEEYVTPTVFNGFMAKVLDSQRRTGNTDTALAFRLGLVGSDKIELKLTKPPDKEPKKMPDGTPLYINLEAVGTLEVVDGELRAAHVDTLVLRHREAPFLARMVVNHFLGKLIEKSKAEKGSANNELMQFKLVRREGDRIHFILDGKAIRENEKRKQEQQDKAPDNSPKEKTGTF